MKAFYVQLNKCASTSIIRLVRQCANLHCMQDLPEWQPYECTPESWTIQSAGRTEANRKVFGAQYDDWFKFSFVRNPWSRMVSAWQWMCFNRPGEPGPMEFAEFVAGVYDRHGTETKGWTQEAVVHFSPQAWNLSRADGTFDVQFVGKIEDLEQDFRRLCAAVGQPVPQNIPHLLRGSHKPWQEYYTDETRMKVAQVFEQDILAFGYRFE